MGDRFGMLTDKAYPIIGILFLVGVVSSYIMPQFTATLGLILGAITFLMLALKAYDKEFEIRAGLTGTVSVTVVGLIMTIVGLGLFGISLSAIPGVSLGGITPALPQLLSILAAAVGGGLLLWGTLGTIREIL